MSESVALEARSMSGGAAVPTLRDAAPPNAEYAAGKSEQPARPPRSTATPARSLASLRSHDDGGTALPELTAGLVGPVAVGLDVFEPHAAGPRC